jgi:hypothetical protein
MPEWHAACPIRSAVGPGDGLTGSKHPQDHPSYHSFGAYTMTWTKPEAEVVAVTMEVTAYVATL